MGNHRIIFYRIIMRLILNIFLKTIHMGKVTKLWLSCGTWFCYQLIAKPGKKTAAVSWPDPYITKKTPMLVAQILATNFDFVPGWWCWFLCGKSAQLPRIVFVVHYTGIEDWMRLSSLHSQCLATIHQAKFLVPFQVLPKLWPGGLL